MKKINLFILINLIFAVIFSILNICFAADVSCLGFLVSLIYTSLVLYVCGIKFARNKNLDKAFASRKIFQYEPYVFLIAFIVRRAGAKGTVFAFDLISVITWLFVFVSAVCLSHYLDPKRFAKLTGEKIKEVKNESLGKMFAKGKTRDGSKVTGTSYVKWFIFEILDWADALVQAVFMVLLFQIFFFQFYKIPTESMVPEYMVNDRVAVSKITSGPRFPLSEVGIPCIKEYKRGDIVVFRNPHYSMDRNSEVKTVVSQLVYMLTFTLVNTNLDEHGKIKADPLVKRITGVGGEQLMMQDGVLYARTKDNPEFLPVKEDAKWAAYNLNEENSGIKALIRDFKVSDEIYAELLDVESVRNSIDLEKAGAQCKQLASEFNKYVYKKSAPVSDDVLINMYQGSDLFEYSLCRDYSMLARNLMTVENGGQWFTAFMTDWTESVDGLKNGSYIGGNLYEESNYRLNILFKLSLGALCVETARNLYNQVPSSQWETSAYMLNLENQLRVLHNYICFMDRRNMPPFPANDESGNPQYIPENCFFMMGDNRFNSFDMRHTDTEFMTKLTAFDNYSVTFYSNMKPMYVPKKLILGSTGVRFWPLLRPVRNAR